MRVLASEKSSDTKSRCNQFATFRKRQRVVDELETLVLENISLRFSFRESSSWWKNNNRNELENWGRKRNDKKQSAIKINSGNFAVLSCVVRFSLFSFHFNLEACTIFHRLLYLAQLRKKRKQKRGNFSRDGCFGMFMMIINIITERLKKCLFELLSWACVQQQQRSIIISRLETDIYDVCIASFPLVRNARECLEPTR